jgi:hypothetical protein
MLYIETIEKMMEDPGAEDGFSVSLFPSWTLLFFPFLIFQNRISYSENGFHGSYILLLFSEMFRAIN